MNYKFNTTYPPKRRVFSYMAVPAIERISKRRIEVLQHPEQWDLLSGLLREYYYKSKFQTGIRFVQSCDNPRGIIDRIVRGVLHSDPHLPVPFVSFHGVADKPHLDEKDMRGMNAILGLQEFIGNYYQPGIELTVLLADVHGVNNGYQNESYLRQVERYYDGFPFVKTLYLSSLYEQYALRLPQPHDIDSTTRELLTVNTKLAERLEKQSRHYRGPYHGLGHLVYAQMRLQERAMLEKEFGERILMIHGSPENSRALLPSSMGKFYLTVEPHWFR